MLTRRSSLVGGATLIAGARHVSAAPVATLRLGVLSDQSGPYRDNGGQGSLVCVQQAVADFIAHTPLSVEVVSADHGGKPDVGLAIARRWYDEGVDAILDFQNSAIALGGSALAQERDKIALPCNAATTELTGRKCNANTICWAYDTYMLAKVVGGALVRAGGSTWFFLTADYAFGIALEADTSRFVQAAGGRVLGSIKTPFPSTDFSSALLTAQASGAKVIALANSSQDTVNSVKQAAEFQIAQSGTKIATLLTLINDVHSLGLETAQGLVLATVFYWDLNDRARAFSARVSPLMQGRKPAMGQAGCYGATTHLLRAAAAMGVDQVNKSGREAVVWMKAHETDDDAFGRCTIREDGRVLHTAYLCEVKKPQESKKPWDYYKVLATVPSDQAWRPLADGACPLVTH
jgi:branched-chain amino acid transport system substrate-binding protein